MLSILSFNILAPHFANPSHYPPGMSDALSQEYRRNHTTRFLTQMKELCDIIGFQEVTHGDRDHPCSYDEFTYLIDLLGEEFIGMFQSHEPHYWSDYGRYVPIGNALFFRRSVFSEPSWYDVSLRTGNHAILAEVTHLTSMQKIRILNVHFDSESHTQRNRELTMALSSLPSKCGTIDIILGDFNMEISDSAFGQIKRTAFRDVLSDVNIKDPTFSFMTDEPIDHIVYRDSSCSGIIPIRCRTRIFGNDLWNKYPKLGIIDIFAGSRLKECLDLYGSDHFPILATFMISPAVMTCT